MEQKSFPQPYHAPAKVEEEKFPKTAREWLEDALGRYQVTHIHSSIREALKAMDAAENG
jgi:hypothetical protein